ncbi:MAG: site-2 protease family protein [Christensenellaceae bacterium]|jgi:stage IV sporulation protein FB|nr:site-2 protease family protein [Christensenellaceae bacterium]
MHKGITLKIHPSFWILLTVTFCTGSITYLLYAVVSVILHELGHACAAYSRGYYPDTITLTPLGATLSGMSNISKDDMFSIALAGPRINISIATCVVCIWWFFPVMYGYTLPLYEINLALAVFNLLPVLPLDGAKIVLSFAGNAQKAVRMMKTFSIILSCIFFIGYLISLFYNASIMLLLVGCSVFISSIEQTKSESFVHVATLSSFLRVKDQPLEIKTFRVSSVTTLLRILRQIRKCHYALFYIENDCSEIIAKLNEQDVFQICQSYSLHTQLKEVDLSSYSN